MSNQSFFKRNLVTIVVVPGIILAHYGWWKLQYNDSLVEEHERNGMPIVNIGKKLMSKLTNLEGSKNDSINPTE